MSFRIAIFDDPDGQLVAGGMNVASADVRQAIRSWYEEYDSPIKVWVPDEATALAFFDALEEHQAGGTHAIWCIYRQKQFRGVHGGAVLIAEHPTREELVQLSQAAATVAPGSRNPFSVESEDDPDRL